MFAFPAFRDTAPQSPPVGCLMDWIAFYWSMLLSVIGSIGLSARYLLQPPEAAEPDEAAENKKATEKQPVEDPDMKKSKTKEPLVQVATETDPQEIRVEMGTSAATAAEGKTRKRKKAKAQPESNNEEDD